ncbi:MAG: DUF2723 domain-containing protein [Patescibacteria group bacterium]
MISIIFALLFAFLSFHQSLYIFGGDSAEFSFVARSFSIAHPPGYPLYSILAIGANLLIPFLTTPWRVAFISNIATVATSYILFHLLIKLRITKKVALFSSILYVFLFPVWQYSLIPEVFTLNNLLTVSITYLLFTMNHKDFNKLVLVFLLLGLSISHHHIFVLYLPCWIYLAFRKNLLSMFSMLPNQKKAILLLVFIVGILFYLYAPVASFFNPPLDWENPKTLSGFVRLITRQSYGTFKAYSGSSGNILNQFFDVASLAIFLLHDFRIIGILLIIVGAIFLYRRDRKLFVAFGILTLSHIFFLFYTNFTLASSFTTAMYERFLISVYMVLIIYLAHGTDFAYLWTKKSIKKLVKNPFLYSISIYAVTLFFIGYLAIIFFQNYKVMKQIRNLDVFAVYAKDLLSTVPKNSIFFVGTDNSHFTTIYYHFAEKYRSDIKYVFVNALEKPYYRKELKKKYPELYIPDNYQRNKDLKAFFEKNNKHGIFLETPLSNHAWKPYGLLWKFYESEKHAASDSAKLIQANKDLWKNLYTLPQLDRQLRKILHINVVEEHYVNSYVNFSKLLYWSGDIDAAQSVMEEIVNKYRPNDLKNSLILVNLYVADKKCEKAKHLMSRIQPNVLTENNQLLPSYGEYLIECDPENPNLDSVVQKIKKIEKNKKIPIHKL